MGKLTSTSKNEFFSLKQIARFTIIKEEDSREVIPQLDLLIGIRAYLLIK